MSIPPWGVVAACLLCLSCKGKDGASAVDSSEPTDGWTPDVYCPGDPSGICEDGTGSLWAGAGKADITPVCFESWEDLDGDGEWDDDTELFLDCGCDRLCSDDPGYPGADDGEEDGEFQAVWLAGFQNGRPAAGVHDPLWARGIVLEQGDVRVGIVSVDLIGLFNSDVIQTREKLVAAGVDLDYLLVSSTHVHEGPDTIGLWGQFPTRSGVQADYQELVQDAIVTAIGDAVADLREVATMQVGAVDVSTYSDRGALNVVRDSRDPKIIDTNMGGAIFQDASGATIASLAHFGNHPEAIADENTQITSDYAHALRETLESGVSWDSYTRDGLGGTAIFISGNVGGMMTPLGITVVDPDANSYSEYSFEKNQALGSILGEMALDAIEGGALVEAPDLEFATHRFRLPVVNWGFQAMFLSGIIDREIYDWDETQPISDDNIPSIDTEIAYIRVGGLELVSVPGELLPELAIGGYDGSRTGSPSEPIIDADNDNPPDLDQAPSGPYLRDLLQAEHGWFVGLGNDEVGYIIPEYNFQVDETVPWFDEAPGDHYEETNSLGPETASLYQAEFEKLIDWVYAH